MSRNKKSDPGSTDPLGNIIIASGGTRTETASGGDPQSV
jgi:hypothetical protein